MVINGYTVDIYCDYCDCFYGRGFTQAVGRTYSDCKRQLERRGWRFRRTKDGEKHSCPGCRDRRKPRTEES